MTRDDGSPMGAGRVIGDMLGLDEIPRLEPIAGNVVRCTRKDLWPEHVREEMERIWPK